MDSPISLRGVCPLQLALTFRQHANPPYKAARNLTVCGLDIQKCFLFSLLLSLLFISPSI